MKTEPIHVKEIQNAIVNLTSLAETLFETETHYEDLLKEVLKHRYSDEGWPPMKAYEEKLMLKPGQAKSMLIKIFDDLMQRVCAYKEPRYKITDVVHQIYVQNYGKSFTFRCQLIIPVIQRHHSGAISATYKWADLLNNISHFFLSFSSLKILLSNRTDVHFLTICPL